MKAFFVEAGQKTAYVSRATPADFADRMVKTKGCLFWASQEAMDVIDSAWAMGKGKVAKNSQLIEHGLLLDTRNVRQFGPTSIKACPTHFFVPRTNFGTFHAA